MSLSGKGRRSKGVRGEREVRDLVEGEGLAVRGLEDSGDHLVICADALTLHLEVKRQETTRILAWCRQAEDEAPAGTVPVVVFRPSNEPWRATLSFKHLLALLPKADEFEWATDGTWSVPCQEPERSGLVDGGELPDVPPDLQR